MALFDGTRIVIDSPLEASIPDGVGMNVHQVIHLPAGEQIAEAGTRRGKAVPAPQRCVDPQRPTAGPCVSMASMTHCSVAAQWASQSRSCAVSKTRSCSCGK